MSDEFLLRVDEELPSDERVAVKLIETRVMSDSYRIRLEALVDKIEKMSMPANTEVLSEIKNILSDMLSSISAVNKRYAIILDAIERIEMLSSQAPEGDNTELKEKLDTLSRGAGEILADIQTSISALENKYDAVSEVSLRLHEKMGELSVSGAEINERIENLAANNNESLDKIHASIDSLGIRSNKLSDIILKLDERLSEISMDSNDVMGKLDEKLDKVSGGSEDIINIRESIASIKSKYDIVSEIMLKVDEKLSELYASNAETLGRVEEKISAASSSVALDNINSRLDQLSFANSEKLGGIENKIDRLSDNTLLIETIEEKIGGTSELNDTIEKISGKLDHLHETNSKKLGVMEEKIGEISVMNAEIIEKLQTKEINPEKLDSIEEKVGGLSVRSAEFMNHIDEKLDDVHINSKGVLNQLENMSGISSATADVLSEINEKIANMAPVDNSDVLEKINSKIGKLSEKTGLIENVNTTITSLDEKYSNLKKYHTALNRLSRSQNRLNTTLKDVNTYFYTLNSVDFMLRLLNAKLLLKKRRLPVWARQRRTALLRSIVDLENEVIDILVITTIPKEGISIQSLVRAIGRGRKRTKDRLVRLIAEGRVEERRVKRRKLYFLVV
ncbi:MAG: hypothetical protein WC613_00130 [Candidatus Aenigmatarchaeota archaeon]